MKEEFVVEDIRFDPLQLLMDKNRDPVSAVCVEEDLMGRTDGYYPVSDEKKSMTRRCDLIENDD